MERLTVVLAKNSYDTFDPIDIVDNEYSKINYEKVLTKLGQYEDAEEQELLLRLPKELSNVDKRIIEYSLVKAINLVRYGIEVDDRLENATQISSAINQAYLRGIQDGRNRFSELRKEEAEQKLKEMESD